MWVELLIICLMSILPFWVKYLGGFNKMFYQPKRNAVKFAKYKE
jgi:hypothetical protein